MINSVGGLASERQTLWSDKIRKKTLPRPQGWKGAKGASMSPLRTESYVDELGVVTLLQVVEDRSIVEVGQIGHVFGFLILGRVHLLQLILLEVLGLSSRPREKRKNGLVVKSQR